MKHDHEHNHSVSSFQRLWWVFSLSVIYMIAEIVGGLWSNSLALLADAGHMAIDSAGIGLGLFAAWVSSKPPNDKKTFGYYRAEILAAFVNGIFLIGASLWILVEAWNRFADPRQIQGELMSGVALGGLIVNLIGVKLLHSHSHENLNLKGVWLHLLSDLLGSVSAILAGVCVWKLGWLWADAASSVLISLLILVGAWRLVSEAVHVLLDGVPHRIETSKIKSAFEKVPGVKGVFDLHVWAVSSGVHALSCHVAIDEKVVHASMLEKLNEILEHEFSITHSTIQLEPEGFHREGHHPDHCELGHKH
ncbi:MAG: cation transporter [Proteobacteria bacterium]|nr:cation transporter [Pseudomonadota bacterium]